ncbi:O-antigen ligase family protein [Alsobacter sp. SYSU M60028]|uniref:O-antigen ligase family protein n=1 Tax=Alsobacter ponti TaxID=2962936 RepID=A0ABT1LAD2_9HYPH|nr:O-antigen ligase family protein [Alsobacter ponti]MCP8938419.1 O-antigen ligase family protein [Alsobacter ponti]
MTIDIPLRSEVTRSWSASDLAAIGLIVFGCLNLNGAFLLVTGIDSFFSPFALVLSIGLCVLCFRASNVTVLYSLFFLFMVSYLGFGSWENLNANNFESKSFTPYAATLLMVSGLYFFYTAASEEQLTSAARITKACLLLACVFTLGSDDLSRYFNYVAAEERASGLFANPNEAAVVALYALVLTVAYPAKRPLVSLLQIGLAVAALVLTFSKNGMLMLAVLGALYLIQRRSLSLSLVALGAVASLYVLGWYIVEYDVFGFSDERRERIVDVMSLMSGEFNERTTTGRTNLWQFGLAKINQTFPWGSGLGQFHFLEGGVRNNVDQWLGVHNTYLMVLGEAGLLPLILLLAFLARLVGGAIASSNRTLLVGCAVILLGDMVGVHGALAFRAHDVLLPLLMAGIVRGESAETEERAEFDDGA